MRRETKTWAGRLVAAAAVAFVLAYLPYHLYARSGLARTLTLRRDLAALRARNRELSQENTRLAREAAALRDDASAVERVARVELGWVKPGEIVVVDDSFRSPRTGSDPPAMGSVERSATSPDAPAPEKRP
jgi:cell division protein FtsB